MITESRISQRQYTEYDHDKIRTDVGALGYDFQYRNVTGTTMNDAIVSDRPTVWVADFQTHGRGRPGNGWEAQPNASVLVTFAQTEDLTLKNPLLLPQLASLAASRAIRKVTGIPVQIRWPYDLEADRKKYGGVLVEKKKSTANGKPLTLVGIGINVHDQSFPKFPWEAVALEQISGVKPLDRNEILIELTKEWSAMKDIMHIVDSDPQAYATWNRIWQEHQSLGGQRVRAENVGPDGIGDLDGVARIPVLGKLLDLVSTDAEGARKVVTVSRWDAFSLIRTLE